MTGFYREQIEAEFYARYEAAELGATVIYDIEYVHKKCSSGNYTYKKWALLGVVGERK